VIPRYLKQVISGGSLVVFGGGEQTRDFVYIDDVVGAISAAAQQPKLNRTVLNVGSGRETSIAQLVTTIEEVTGHEAHRINRAVESAGVSRLVADVSRAGEVLGFTPAVDLRKGLRMMTEKDARFRMKD